MDVQKIEMCLEDFRCRIPALFPYIEFNADGTTETHVATDSPNGSYTKVVDNMKTPFEVRLTNYVPVPYEDINPGYQWGEENTIGLSEDINRYFSVSGASFLRKAVRYSYVRWTDGNYTPDAITVEELPEYVSDNSPMYVKILLKTVDDVTIVCDGVVQYDYYEKVGKYVYYARKDIIEPCTTYSYRTIINEYYKYRDIVGDDNSFIKFVENGIGFVKVDRTLLNLQDMDKYPEVPDFIYLSQVKRLIGEYTEYKKAYIHYNTYYLANGKTSESLSQKAATYIRMGGDNFTNWLLQIEQKSYDMAQYYKCCADNKDFDARFCINAMLSKHTDIVGLERVVENLFVPGNRYYDGDLLTYEGKTYVCKLDRLLQYGNNYKYIRKNTNIDGIYVNALYELNSGETEYTRISNANITYVPSSNGVPSQYTSCFVVVNNETYKWNGEGYVRITVTEYSTGVWDEESEKYVFDNQHFVLLSDLDGYNEWYDAENLNGDNYIYFVDLDYIPSYRIYDYIRFNDSVFRWDTDEEAYVPCSDNDTAIYLSTNSKLKTLRVQREYINPLGVAIEPDSDEDWLWYYKVGTINSKMVETDEYGNIVTDTNDFVPGEVCYDLHAYGNVLISIEYDSDTNRITFKYAIGAHLLAEADSIDQDVDGNPIKRYKNFMYDDMSGDGVVFTETYNCIGDEIQNLGDHFQPYVEGDETTMLMYAYRKFPFETIPVVMLDGSVCVEGSGVALFDAYGDLQHSKTIHEEWMTGLYFQPKVKSSLSVDRGNGASFDRHIRLGEIHTMEDFENYQNGGFFKISEN